MLGSTPPPHPGTAGRAPPALNLPRGVWEMGLHAPPPAAIFLSPRAPSAPGQDPELTWGVRKCVCVGGLTAPVLERVCQPRALRCPDRPAPVPQRWQRFRTLHG